MGWTYNKSVCAIFLVIQWRLKIDVYNFKNSNLNFWDENSTFYDEYDYDWKPPFKNLRKQYHEHNFLCQLQLINFQNGISTPRRGGGGKEAQRFSILVKIKKKSISTNSRALSPLIGLFFDAISLNAPISPLKTVKV